MAIEDDTPKISVSKIYKEFDFKSKDLETVDLRETPSELSNDLFKSFKRTRL